MQNFKFFFSNLEVTKTVYFTLMIPWVRARGLSCAVSGFGKKKKRKKRMTRFAASVFGRRSKMSEDYVK